MVTKLHTGFQFKIFLNLIRALFPNWNFFDRIAYKFELEFKIKDSVSWEPLIFNQKRGFFSIFLNPDCNLALAHVNIIEHFVQDIQTLQNINPLVHSNDVRKLTTFKMIKSLLIVKLGEYEIENPTLQFKVVASNLHDKHDIYISDLMTLDLL